MTNLRPACTLCKTVSQKPTNQPVKKTKHPMFTFQTPSHKANEPEQGGGAGLQPQHLGAQGKRVGSSGPASATK